MKYGKENINQESPLKRKEEKSTQQILTEMVNIYHRLPQEEQIIMRNKIQSIINTYGKEQKH